MFNPLQQVYIDSLKKQLEEDRIVINHVIPDTVEHDDYWNEEWNRMHYKSVKLRNDLFADYCEKVILKAKDHYYKTGEPLMSDHRYDNFERTLRSLRPESIVLLKVGA